MNDLVKNLIEKATVERHHERDWDSVSYEFDKNLFAELFIQESINLLKKEWYDLNSVRTKSNENARAVAMRVGAKAEVIKLIEMFNKKFNE